MSNQDFFPPFETAQNTVTGLPPRRKNKSIVWDSFTAVPDSDKAQCNFCNALLKCTNETTSMMAHAIRCKGKPNAPNKRLKSTTSSAVTSPSLAKFDQEKCRQAVVKMIVTMELPSANDSGMEILKMRLNSTSALAMNGDHMHMRCCAHIINLIVREGLKEIDISVVRIRNAIKLIRISTSRYRKFLSCVKKRHIKYKGFVNFDCETRWNATHDMLKGALKLQEAFVELEVLDAKYCQELNKGKGVPAASDWENARVISTFLKIFKKATLRISGSSYVTSNTYMGEVFAIGMTLKQTIASTNLDSTTMGMATRMKQKYDKYWGDPKSLNMLLLIAFVLDPRKKLNVANWFIDECFDALEASELKTNLDSFLKEIYDTYSGGVGEAQSDLLPTQVLGEGNDPDYYLQKYLIATGTSSSAAPSSDLSKYLNEALESRSPEFCILNWWRVNSSRLPILAIIARDVLAIPVSTVASESAFSTGGRVVDEYRSSLTAQSVEALICTADWLNGGRVTLFPSQEDIEEIEKFEREILSQNLDGGASSTQNLD